MIEFKNTLDEAQAMRLREAVGFRTITPRQLSVSWKNSSFALAGYDGERLVCMIRMVYDGANSALITDVIVHPAYQRQGLGRQMLERVKEFIRETLENGESASITLVANRGKEGFYKKMGFFERPNAEQGSGMSLFLAK